MAKKKPPETSAQNVRITIDGDVGHTNIIVGDSNQVTSSSQPTLPGEKPPLPRYMPSDELPPPGDLPLGSSLPFPRNPLFAGREAQLRALAEALTPALTPAPSPKGRGGRETSVVINQAIAGMGGVGKTQLAVEFAYRFGRYFRGVHWLNLADPSQLDAEIARCGRAMNLANFPDDQPSQVALTLHVWKSDGPRLVILDNFEEPAALQAALSQLGHSSLRLLITSRRTDWPPTSGLRPLPLEVFTPAESLDFLRRALPKRRDRDEELARLAEQLGHLPLALELAARYLNGHPRLGLEAYLEQCRAALEHPSMRAWRADLPAPTGHDLDLQRTFAFSWQQVQDETARGVFRMAGYLAPNVPIPPEIFERALDLSSEACDETLGLLYGLGLLKEGEDHLPAIHPLLAEYARLLARETGGLLEKLADALGDLSNEALETGLPAHFQLLRPHLPLLAAHAETANLEAAGRLWNSFGYHLWMVADYPAARAAYERALKIDEAAFGPDHPEVATDVNNLGLVLHALGDLAGARAAFERALKIDEAAFGPDHPKVAIRVNNLGGVLHALGDLAGARAAFERALKIDEAAFGPDHPDVATDVNNLGNVLYALGDLAGARAAFERALRILEAALGSEHPQVALGVNNLGEVLRQQGDLAGARVAFERALRIWEAALGSEHPQVALGVNNLGEVLRQQGDLAGARAAFERALRIFEQQLGEDHPNVATLVNNLGLALRDLGDLAGARVAFERALRIWEAALGSEHPQVATAVNNLGSVLQDMGDLAGARQAFERVLKILEKTLPENHPYVAATTNNLGSVLRDLGDLAGARAAFERALKIFQKSLPPDHPNIKIVQGNLDSLEG
jgi:tetratricopeptide (TPR) repeat protein